MRRIRPRRPGFDTTVQRELIWDEYDRFLHSNSAGEDPEVTKRFGARHTAARTAVAHIEALQKIEGSNGEETHDNSSMVAQARAAMAQENVADEPEDDE